MRPRLRLWGGLGGHGSILGQEAKCVKWADCRSSSASAGVSIRIGLTPLPLFQRFLHELALVQLPVKPLVGKQVTVLAGFDDPSLVENIDDVTRGQD